MKCKNCGNSINESFCSYCGQRTTVNTINFKTLISEFQNQVFQINRGFLFTIKELIVRPGHAIRDFISGRRKPYFKPISFLIVSITIYVFAAYLLGVDSFLAKLISSFKDGFDSTNEGVDKLGLKSEGIFEWLKTNQTYLVFVFVPIFALASFIAFLKSKYNYYEHLVFQLYIIGQQFVIMTIFTCAFFFNQEILQISIVFCFIFYNLFAYYQFFKRKKFIEILLRYILIQILFLILYFIISFIIIFIGIIIAKLIESHF